MTLKLDEYGAPLHSVMEIERLDNVNLANSKVRDTKWVNDPKPYAGRAFKTAMSSGEGHCLYDMVKRLGPGNYANLGVASGYSTWHMAWGLKHSNHQGRVYAVDLFNWEGREGYYKIPQVTERLDEVMNLVKICEGFTHDWAEQLKDVKFNGVFIDADHNYETCKLDFDLWGAMVHKGGEIAFHDTHFSTVDRVLREMGKEWVQTEHVHSLKLYKKV